MSIVYIDVKENTYRDFVVITDNHNVSAVMCIGYIAGITIINLGACTSLI